MLRHGVIRSMEDAEDDDWWRNYVQPILETNMVYVHMGKGGRTRALRSWDRVKSFLRDRLADPGDVIVSADATLELMTLPTAKQFLQIMQKHGLRWTKVKPAEAEVFVPASVGL